MKGRDRPRKKGIAIMALTKSQVLEYLSEAGIEAGKASVAAGKIMDGHTTSINVLRERAETAERERNAYKAEAEKLPGLQKELNDLKAADFEGKYKAEHEALEKLKADTEAQATKAAKEAAFAALLKDAFTPDGAEIIKKHADLSGVELTKDGAIKGAEKFLEELKADWKPFVKTITTQGANIPTPPTNAAPSGGDNMTLDEIYKIEDATERQQAINEHPALFGYSSP